MTGRLTPRATDVSPRNNTNQKLYDRVYDYLRSLQANGKYGIEKIFTKEELLEKYGQSGPYSFIVEAAAMEEAPRRILSLYRRCPSGESKHLVNPDKLVEVMV